MTNATEVPDTLGQTWPDEETAALKKTDETKLLPWAVRQQPPDYSGILLQLLEPRPESIEVIIHSLKLVVALLNSGQLRRFDDRLYKVLAGLEYVPEVKKLATAARFAYGSLVRGI